MVLAAFLFIRRMAGAADVRAVDGEFDLAGAMQQPAVAAVAPVTPAVPRGRYSISESAPVPKGVEVYEISGPFFFGAASAFKDAIGRIARRPKVMVLRLGRVPVIDSTGLRTLADVVRRLRNDGTLVILCELHDQPRSALSRSPVMDDVGEENVSPTFDAALATARDHIEASRALA